MAAPHNTEDKSYVPRIVQVTLNGGNSSPLNKN